MSKKTKPVAVSVAVALALAGAACGGGGDAPAERAQTETEKEVWVAHFTTPCEGVGPRECLNVREADEPDWKLWYGSIEGFEHEPGTEYHMMVTETEIEDPPADAPSVRWTLIEVIDERRVAAAADEGDPILRAWQLVAFGPAADLGEEPSATAIRETLSTLEGDGGVTLDLSEEGRAAGFDGCNRYFGDFRIEYGHQIVQGPMASTMMACPDVRMQLERSYLNNLGAAVRMFRRDGKLELENDAGVLLVFDPAETGMETAE